MHGVEIYFVGFCAIDRVWQKAAMKERKINLKKKNKRTKMTIEIIESGLIKWKRREPLHIDLCNVIFGAKHEEKIRKL